MFGLSTMNSRLRPTLRPVLILFGLLIAAAPMVRACNVPVFRFALERWVSDNYVMVIAHDTPPTPEQQQAIAGLKALSSDHEGMANLTVQVLDLKATPEDPAVGHLPLGDITLPAAFLFYPAAFGTPTLVWKAPLGGAELRDPTTSPVRDDFAARMTRGSSAVWFLLESDDKEANDRAEQVLRESLTAVEQDLELPAGVILPSGKVTGTDSEAADHGFFDAENRLESGIPLRIGFDVVRLPAFPPGEEVFLSMLLNAAPGLLEKRSQPMVFPLFGRGRILAPLVGGEIRPDAIAAVASYLCGPCSCQVKAQNPGVDLLLAVNWKERLAGLSAIPERELPPLGGTSSMIGETQPPAPTSTGEHPRNDNPLRRNLTRTAGAALALVILATIMMVKRNR
jgi:hypothetical protein